MVHHIPTPMTRAVRKAKGRGRRTATSAEWSRKRCKHELTESANANEWPMTDHWSGIRSSFTQIAI